MCADTTQFEAMIQAQLASQLMHTRARMRQRELETEAVQTSDPAVASRALHKVGALKTYTPERVTANANLEALSTAQLNVMLRQQRAIQSNALLLRSLPDGGAKVHTQVRAIEAQLEARRAQEESQMQEVERLLDQVNIATPASAADTEAAVTNSTDAQQSQSQQVGGGAAMAASSSAAATSSAAAAAASTTSAAAAAAAARGPSAASSSVGRGSAAAAAHCASDVVNARILRDNSANIESKFRRAPPSVLSAEEAARLMQVKADDWNADGMSFGGGGGGHSRAQTAAYRESNAAGADFEDDEEDFDISDDDFDHVDDDQLSD